MRGAWGRHRAANCARNGQNQPESRIPPEAPGSWREPPQARPAAEKKKAGRPPPKGESDTIHAAYHGSMVWHRECRRGYSAATARSAWKGRMRRGRWNVESQGVHLHRRPCTGLELGQQRVALLGNLADLKLDGLGFDQAFAHGDAPVGRIGLGRGLPCPGLKTQVGPNTRLYVPTQALSR